MPPAAGGVRPPVAPSGTAYPRATMSAPPPADPDRRHDAPTGTDPVRDRLADAVAAAVATVAAEGGLDLAVDPATCTWSARPAVSTATGRPTSPW